SPKAAPSSSSSRTSCKRSRRQATSIACRRAASRSPARPRRSRARRSRPLTSAREDHDSASNMLWCPPRRGFGALPSLLGGGAGGGGSSEKEGRAPTPTPSPRREDAAEEGSALSSWPTKCDRDGMGQHHHPRRADRRALRHVRRRPRPDLRRDAARQHRPPRSHPARRLYRADDDPHPPPPPAA